MSVSRHPFTQISTMKRPSGESTGIIQKMTKNFGGKNDARYKENHGIEKPVIPIFYCNIIYDLFQ